MNYANHLGYTDVNPYEIIKRLTEKTIEIREMKCEQDMSVKPSFDIGGFSAHSDNAQKWFITPDEQASIIKIRLHKDNKWYDKHGRRFNLSDSPRKFYDYNF
jgi:hypothetical protein